MTTRSAWRITSSTRTWHAGIPKGAGADLKALADRTLWAKGIFGQTIAIDPAQNVVMVQWSTYKDAEGSDALGDEQLLFLHALERSLRGVP